MSARLTKDASIWRLLGELADRLDAHGFQVVDHWDADLFSIGIARVDAPERLVYVSTYRQPAGRYAYECEEPDGEQEYEVTGRADGVILDHLVEIIRAHLSLNNGSPQG